MAPRQLRDVGITLVEHLVAGFLVAGASGWWVPGPEPVAELSPPQATTHAWMITTAPNERALASRM